MVNAAPRARADRRKLSALCVQETAERRRGKKKEQRLAEKRVSFVLFRANDPTAHFNDPTTHTETVTAGPQQLHILKLQVHCFSLFF
jgi:hypothetical protein